MLRGVAAKMADEHIDNPIDPLDAELVRQVQQGDHAAFGVLVRRYQHRIIALMARYTGDRAQAEDLAQDAFLRAWRSIAGFRGDAQFYTWLHRIAINTAKNHLVAQKRRPPSEDIDAIDAEQFEGALRMRDADTPERELLRHEIEQAVMRAVEKLPRELRMALTLREVDGLAYDEIAQRLDCPIGTVRSRIFRAREAVDAELRPLLDASATSRQRGRA